MNNRVLQKADELLAKGVPFALATVVRRERPTSGEPGDKAIITSDGEFLGWIGGSCAQPTVLQEAKRALADGEPRLVVLTPNLDAEAREGVEIYRMSCYSGGTLEIYIEPYLPEPELLVCGASPAAEALVKIGAAVGFKVFLIDPSATKEKFPAADVVLSGIEPEKFGDNRERYAVVATNGNWDDEAIKGVLPLRLSYLGLVASKNGSGRCAKTLWPKASGRTNSTRLNARRERTCRRALFRKWRSALSLRLSPCGAVRRQKGRLCSGPRRLQLLHWRRIRFAT
jgi:xanthine dehydrogenase accessory factor